MLTERQMMNNARSRMSLQNCHANSMEKHRARNNRIASYQSKVSEQIYSSMHNATSLGIMNESVSSYQIGEYDTAMMYRGKSSVGTHFGLFDLGGYLFDGQRSYLSLVSMSEFDVQEVRVDLVTLAMEVFDSLRLMAMPREKGDVERCLPFECFAGLSDAVEHWRWCSSNVGLIEEHVGGLCVG